jgi:hypothetical protein
VNLSRRPLPWAGVLALGCMSLTLGGAPTSAASYHCSHTQLEQGTCVVADGSIQVNLQGKGRLTIPAYGVEGLVPQMSDDHGKPIAQHLSGLPSNPMLRPGALTLPQFLKPGVPTDLAAYWYLGNVLLAPTNLHPTLSSQAPAYEGGGWYVDFDSEPVTMDFFDYSGAIKHTLPMTMPAGSTLLGYVRGGNAVIYYQITSPTSFTIKADVYHYVQRPTTDGGGYYLKDSIWLIDNTPRSSVSPHQLDEYVDLMRAAAAGLMLPS